VVEAALVVGASVAADLAAAVVEAASAVLEAAAPAGVERGEVGSARLRVVGGVPGHLARPQALTTRGAEWNRKNRNC
jgi:hypothetical protein